MQDLNNEKKDFSDPLEAYKQGFEAGRNSIINHMIELIERNIKYEGK